MADVTVLVLTKNEEVNLPDCLESLKGFAKRIVVVDSESTDKTKAISEAYCADFYVHPFETHARQFNWGLDNAGITTKWTMRIDADERLTPELSCELEEIMQEHDNDDVNGVSMESWLYFLGKKICYGCHNKRKLMLFKTGLGRSEDRRIDEHTYLLQGTSVYAKNRFIHYDFKDMTHWIDKMNWYATREMQDYFSFQMQKKVDAIVLEDEVIQRIRKKKYGIYYKLPMFLRCWMLFVYNYIFRLGFLDGKAGFVYHYMYHRWYRTLVDAKIFEQINVTNKDKRNFEVKI